MALRPRIARRLDRGHRARDRDPRALSDDLQSGRDHLRAGAVGVRAEPARFRLDHRLHRPVVRRRRGPDRRRWAVLPSALHDDWSQDARGLRHADGRGADRYQPSHDQQRQLDAERIAGCDRGRFPCAAARPYVRSVPHPDRRESRGGLGRRSAVDTDHLRRGDPHRCGFERHQRHRSVEPAAVPGRPAVAAVPGDGRDAAAAASRHHLGAGGPEGSRAADQSSTRCGRTRPRSRRASPSSWWSR